MERDGRVLVTVIKRGCMEEDQLVIVSKIEEINQHIHELERLMFKKHKYKGLYFIVKKDKDFIFGSKNQNFLFFYPNGNILKNSLMFKIEPAMNLAEKMNCNYIQFFQYAQNRLRDYHEAVRFLKG